MKLSDTARLLLSRASQHSVHLAEPPKHLPAAARDAVVRSLLKNGLLAETPCLREHLALAWRQDKDGAHTALRIIEASLRAIGIEASLHQAEQLAEDRLEPTTLGFGGEHAEGLDCDPY